VLDDPVRERRPDARQRLDFGLRGVVQIDGVGRAIRGVLGSENRLFLHRPVTSRIRIDPRRWRCWTVGARRRVRRFGGSAEWDADHPADLARAGAPFRTGEPDALPFGALLSRRRRFGCGSLTGEGLLLLRCRYGGSAGADGAHGTAQEDDNGDEGQRFLL